MSDKKLKTALGGFLGEPEKYSEREIDGKFKEICDLETGDCYTVRINDGFINKGDHDVLLNRKVQVETVSGIKQLLND